MAEKELEPWEILQMNAFTRWVNKHLRDRTLQIVELGEDFKSGIMLINLLEIISSKSLGRYNKNPKILPQKLENLGTALKFLDTERVKLVNIGPSDIETGNLKLILGLVWTLILRYQINKKKQTGSEAHTNTGASTVKQELLGWVQGLIPNISVKGFSKGYSFSTCFST
jgi:filamin